MSLSSSLFTGTSGLKNMGNALQVTGNNISNINTLGFKKGRAAFADTLYESVGTQAGTGQIGRGMAIGDVSQNFAQGSFESTGNTTDLSIGGDGFFVMRQSNTENTFYTRAGNFFFDKEGQLVNPEGYIVQGWELDEDTGDDIGAIGDLILDAFTSPPKKSSRVTAITNLDADADSKSVVLSNNWDSSEETPMVASNYEYQTVVKVYDTLGSTHDVTIHYDKKSGTEWEYIVSCNPEEDQRNAVQGTDSQGLLARGTILFSQSSGDILDFTMSEFTGRLGNFRSNGANDIDAIHYEIYDFDELANDGHGFNFQFDGARWDFVDIPGTSVGITLDDKPPLYPNAQIIYSDDSEIELVLNQTDPPKIDADIKIRFDVAAVATDSFGFDINDPNKLHVQGIEGTRYFGEAANDNTTLEINDPGVMVEDSLGLGIIWNPIGGPTNVGEWNWSNPVLADQQGTLLQNIVTDDGAVPVTGAAALAGAPVITINNPNDISMVAETINGTGLKLRSDGAGNWDWNDLLKTADFANTYSINPVNDPTMTITPGLEGAVATTGPVQLLWDETVPEWSLDGAGDLGPTAVNGATITIDPLLSDSSKVTFDLYSADAANSTTVVYTFGTALQLSAGQSITFEIDPTPPPIYEDAYLSQLAPGDDIAHIDFDGGTTSPADLELDFTAVAGIVGGSHFLFDTRPDVPPDEYLNATLKGDQEAVVIDLDGSGNDDDDDDIRFVFQDSLRFGGGLPYGDRSEIDFDIIGSTAWTEIPKFDITQSGYYGFNTDFLGGEFGVTENDIELDLGTVYQETNFVNDSLSTTQYSKSSSTVFQDADGYGAGDLQGVDVASDGIMTGVYSNGQLIPLFRVGLAKFLNNFGLFSEGGNLFRKTRDSGAAITNKPGENGLGTIAPNSLEQSNVDISEEFVNMITNQRGFQANSKTITTVDDMMQTVIQMKR